MKYSDSFDEIRTNDEISQILNCSTTTVSNAYADAKVADAINDGTTTIAPSQNAVFDALVLKADKSNTTLTSYLEIPEQSKPSTPTNATRIYADTSNRLSWIGENGYVRTFDGTANTADRVYTLPDTSGTLPVGTGTTNEITYFSGTNTIASLTTATYPSLTELSYVKGATSSIQTQLNTLTTQINSMQSAQYLFNYYNFM